MTDDKARAASVTNTLGTASGPHFTRRDEIGGLDHDERHILECLGVAVLGVWSSLPRDTQRAIFEYAAAQQAYDPAELRRQIAQFLHDHNE
jgi:hypothetical protein